MSRIKWNLDLLEEVRMQHDEAMTATEQVVNKGRSDLSSMTEEVWEGEDGDMARDQLHDLLNKEMVETWKQLDACNEAIQKAQKTAYESKNFCNRFPQIFSSGSMPSDSDQGACSGDLLCDNGNCSSLKDSMSEAGQSALNVKSKVECAETVLSELETDEAKFDYSSYTQPIKTQTQNVADRTGVYNNAVSKYEQKTQDMDDTFSNELIAATPMVIPVPFNPSCLELGDLVHMKDGDIINFLEEYNSVEMGSKLSDAQLENILATLFDKKDIDVSSLSEKDLGLAFITLPEEQKKAVLMEMGYSREQVDSILESFKGKNAPAAGAAFARTLFDRIAEKNGDKYHSGEDKTGAAKALGLAGLRRPGEKGYGIAKTNAETYAGDEKTFGKASEEKKKENREKKKEKEQNDSANSDSTQSTSANGTGYPEYPIDESLKEEADSYLDETSENYGDFAELKSEYERVAASNDPNDKARAQELLTELGYIYYTLSNDAIKPSIELSTSNSSNDTRTKSINLFSEFVEECCYKPWEECEVDYVADSEFIADLQMQLYSTYIDEIAYSFGSMALNQFASDPYIHMGGLTVNVAVPEDNAVTLDDEKSYVIEVTLTDKGSLPGNEPAKVSFYSSSYDLANAYVDFNYDTSYAEAHGVEKSDIIKSTVSILIGDAWRGNDHGSDFWEKLLAGKYEDAFNGYGKEFADYDFIDCQDIWSAIATYQKSLIDIEWNNKVGKDRAYYSTDSSNEEFETFTNAIMGIEATDEVAKIFKNLYIYQKTLGDAQNLKTAAYIWANKDQLTQEDICLYYAQSQWEMTLYDFYAEQYYALRNHDASDGKQYSSISDFVFSTSGSNVNAYYNNCYNKDGLKEDPVWLKRLTADEIEKKHLGIYIDELEEEKKNIWKKVAIDFAEGALVAGAAAADNIFFKKIPALTCAATFLISLFEKNLDSKSFELASLGVETYAEMKGKEVAGAAGSQAMMASMQIYEDIVGYFAIAKDLDDKNRFKMSEWFGCGYENTLTSTKDNKEYTTYEECIGTINPLYIKVMDKWENEGLLKILEETGTWGEEDCLRIKNNKAFSDVDSLAYKILNGGFDFADIDDYVAFDEIMADIAHEYHACGDPLDNESMHDFWDHAAWMEVQYNYD